MIQDIFPHKLDNHFRPGQTPEDGDTVFLFSGESVLCRFAGERVAFPLAGDLIARVRPQTSAAAADACAAAPVHSELPGDVAGKRPEHICHTAADADTAASIHSELPIDAAGGKSESIHRRLPEGLIYLFDVDGRRYFLGDGERFDLGHEAASTRSGEIPASNGSSPGSGDVSTSDGTSPVSADTRTSDSISSDSGYTPASDGASSMIGNSTRLPEGYEFVPLRQLRRRNVPDKHLIFAAITARHLNDWYRTVRFCGCCGQPLRHSETERAMVCPACGRIFYPRINPAVIVGVTHGEYLLLTRYAGRRLSSYALVAGFTEIGETLEETVAREVMEETGLTVTNIRYYKSQPWGYAADILTGYFCDVTGDPTIHMDARELKEAVWMPRGEIPGQADDFSLTNEMMCAFRDGIIG